MEINLTTKFDKGDVVYYYKYKRSQIKKVKISSIHIKVLTDGGWKLPPEERENYIPKTVCEIWYDISSSWLKPNIFVPESCLYKTAEELIRNLK